MSTQPAEEMVMADGGLRPSISYNCSNYNCSSNKNSNKSSSNKNSNNKNSSGNKKGNGNDKNKNDKNDKNNNCTFSRLNNHSSSHNNLSRSHNNHSSSHNNHSSSHNNHSSSHNNHSSRSIKYSSRLRNFSSSSIRTTNCRSCSCNTYTSCSSRLTRFTQTRRPNRPLPSVKVALHLFCIVCCIVGLAVGFIVLSGTWFGFLAAVLTCSLCGPAIVWSLAETITLWVRKWHHGMHPGAHVAVSLLICLTAMGFGVGIGSMGSQLAHIEEAVAAANATGSTSLGDSAQWLEQWQDQQPGPGSSTPIPGRLFGLSAVLVSISLVHLFLFVRACVDTHRRNKAGSVMVVSYEGGASATGAPPPAFQHDGQRFRSHAVAPTASGEAELNGEHSESTWQDKAHEFPGDEHFVAAELFTPPEPRTKC
ncbi:hypothetical protein RJ55_07368 [Drechmeria coniospora]|nr:hypothetical protein RJ55_07368 [Drechmeria coniospora]